MAMKNQTKIPETFILIKDFVKKHGIGLPQSAGVPKKTVRKLMKFFKTVSDARVQEMVDYPLHEILMVAFIAVLAGATGFTDMELYGKANEKMFSKEFCVKEGIPSHDTFRRVLSIIDTKCLQAATVAFLVDNIKMLKRAFGIKTDGLKQICVDGKTARGTDRLKGTDREVKQLHTLHVYDRTDGICLVSTEVGDKTNEIPVAQNILKLLDLRGTIVSFDALNTQKATIEAIVGQKGDYIAALKGNQRGLFEEALSYFTPARIKRLASTKSNYLEVKEKKHNRIETRKYYITQNVSWLVEAEDWAAFKSLVYYTIHTEDINTGKTTDETYIYMTSLSDVMLCADAIRGHWSVENLLHYHLDVNFFEDDIEIIDRVAFQNLSLLNKMALTLLKLIAPLLKISVRSTRKKLGWNSETIIRSFCALDEDILAEALRNVKV